MKRVEVLVSPAVQAAVKRRNEIYNGLTEELSAAEKLEEINELNQTIASGMSAAIWCEFKAKGWEL